MDDLISRKMVLALPRNKVRSLRTYEVIEETINVTDIEHLPSAQPERLSDDDFETIRIRLNAFKEKLCNQHRWEEAKEYQRIIDRFMAFASTQPEQPEIIHCLDCENWDKTWTNDFSPNYHYCPMVDGVRNDNFYCADAERRTDGDGRD